MTLRQKYYVQKAGIKIALPSEGLCDPSNWSQWMNLKYPTFMRLHGYAELAKYELLTQKQMQDMERLANAKKDAGDSDSDSDEADDSVDDADYVDIEYEDDDDEDDDFYEHRGGGDNDDNDDNDGAGGKGKGKGKKVTARATVSKTGKVAGIESSKGKGSSTAVQTAGSSTAAQTAGPSSSAKKGKGKATSVPPIATRAADTDDNLYIDIKMPVDARESDSVDLEESSEDGSSYHSLNEGEGEGNENQITPRAATFNDNGDVAMKPQEEDEDEDEEL